MPILLEGANTFGSDCTVRACFKHDSPFLLFQGGMCWVHLNLYPAESSLKNLALKFGNVSSNRENITIFITMLQGLRVTIDNEELVNYTAVYE